MTEAPAGVAFDATRQAVARRYQGEALRLGLVGLIGLALAAFLTLPTGLSTRLETWATSLTAHPWAVVALYVLAAVGVAPPRSFGPGREERL
ncbi:MAG: hypothetical protein R3291_02505, partial [Thermoplasmata archaeon]|nr:hypothetical protein [Thermoplasmata archaeon]